jgi:hypothetical protein
VVIEDVLSPQLGILADDGALHGRLQGRVGCRNALARKKGKEEEARSE